MGLDMYLSAKKGKSQYKWRDGDQVIAPKELSNFNVESQEITERYDIGYWRKANHIRGMIVDQYGDDYNDGWQVIDLGLTDIEDMLDTLEQVRDDHSLAETKLPRTDGFFFGDQDYDEYYYKDIDYTIDLFKKVITLLKENPNYTIEYSESW